MSSNIITTKVSNTELLTTVEAVKTELGIPSSDTSQDAKILRRIRLASAVIVGPAGINRPAWLESVEEDLTPDGSHYLFLSRWPIHRVDQVANLDGSDPYDPASYEPSQGNDKDRLYREDCWPKQDIRWTGAQYNDAVGFRDFRLRADYSAGWVLPGDMKTWVAEDEYILGEWVSKSDGTDEDLDYPLIFECTVEGEVSLFPPEWDTATQEGDTLTDGGVTWTAYKQRLAWELSDACILLTISYLEGGLAGAPIGIRAESFEGSMIQYAGSSEAEQSMPPAVRALVQRWR